MQEQEQFLLEKTAVVAYGYLPMHSCMPLLLERTQPVASGNAVAPSQDTPEEGWYIDCGEIWGSFG